MTGSSGLVGSTAVRYCCDRGHDVIGIDNDMRSYFFGPSASTEWNKRLLLKKYKNFKHKSIDIRNQAKIDNLFKNNRFDLIIHAAAQPSHDWAAKEPLTDFHVNATGTLILLEATRKFSPEATFILTSTNKVYGDTPNHLKYVEEETRWELPPKHHYYNGVDETMSIDNNLHSLFGVSKLTSDVMAQEYGKYFGLKTGIFRGGCITGPSHSGAELHGFLAYLVKAVNNGIEYTVYGYKGKQVRDNIHALDLVSAFMEFHKKPRPGEVYNMGGSRHSNISILEAIPIIEKLLNKKAKTKRSKQNRIGDHKWYISDVSKYRSHYSDWDYTYDIDEIIEELCKSAIDNG